MLDRDHLRELREFLRAARQEAKLSQAAVAERVGVSTSTIQQLESGLLKFPKLEMLIAIALALEVNPATLLAAAGVKPEHAAPAQLDWIASQLDAVGIETLIELGHGLVRVRQRQRDMAHPPSSRRAVSHP